MPVKHFNKICDLVNNQESLADERKFKRAAAFIICEVIGNIEEVEKAKYRELFKIKFNLDSHELWEILLDKDFSILDEEIACIKEQIGGEHKYELMQFLKILNQFVMAHGCSQEDYRRFELVRDKLIEEFK
ncbi:MAG: Unknown protein [uncultured Sulfurovum sp.]|uniref:Co-chaperone DjlA N-terminal domain-containing protein n=1 Tax=uncultured Sulfurovum sp. TaxID=269237 RepID=A0A6S6SLT3_9BACT|nr:MAG: Unknown protein [uncultured Sulfurovum sp.]